MISLKLKYTLPLLLITLVCIGGVEVFYRIADNRFAVEVAAVEEPVAAESPIAPAAAGDIGEQVDVETITRRNLFSSRTDTPAAPEPAETDPLAGVELSSLAVTLMGTVTGPDERQRAVIYDKKIKSQDLYQEGDFIYQAMIKKILRGKVILNVEGKDEMLDISEARNVAGAPGSVVIPSTTARRVVSRPVGGGVGPAVQLPGAAPLSIPGISAKPRQLRTFRGGITVQGQKVGPN